MPMSNGPLKAGNLWAPFWPASLALNNPSGAIPVPGQNIAQRYELPASLALRIPVVASAARRQMVQRKLVTLGTVLASFAG
eukprot:CAMPEP_0113970740 /NCGR_PEP_ID=MMETSP0011_2-20120614/11503_1 /TAXON_ID=101924 /ORGANISM="Rhodosorus marinus" /LENGTH=80 /DNA_ID=CAMNT_0000985467 /DNA_START=8 /DNA_END=248 /DNA_ORIENTATION=- /assembly_acc=CAM_ASM_000156